MQSLDQQTKTGGGLDPNTGGKTTQQTISSSLPSRRRRDLLDEDERPMHSHGVLWAAMMVTLAALIAAGTYGYRAIGTYLGKLSQVPAMHDQLVAAGRRIDAAENALGNWTSQRDAWAKRLSSVEARIDGTLRSARKQAEEIVARAQQNMQAELNQRTANLQAKMDRIQSNQQSTDAQLSGLQEQLRQLQAANSREVEGLRDGFRQSNDAGNATMASLNREIARIDQRSGQSQSDLESIHRKVDRERIGFELAVNHDRELAPGVNMDVSHTDISHQRFDGWLWLTPDRRTMWIHGRGLQQPLVFYSQGDDRPRELVVTRVTKYSVVGYLLVPREHAAGPPISSAAQTSGGGSAFSGSEGEK